VNYLIVEIFGKNTRKKVGVGVHYKHMEGDSFSSTQKQDASVVTPSFAPKQIPELSFIPEELLGKKGNGASGTRERCALIGMILGIVAVVSWIVIIFGVVYSIAGIILSIVGLKSNRKKWASIGLSLSILGLVFSLWYAYAAYQGRVNYNYFTSEFWSKSDVQ